MTHPLVVAVADRFPREQFLAALHRRTPSRSAAAALPPHLALIRVATAEHQHLQLPREPLLPRLPVVAVDLHSPLAVDSHLHPLDGLVAVVVHGRHRSQMAPLEQAAQESRVATHKAMAVLLNFKQAVAVAAQVAQA